jgi:hypothetical protein
MGYNQCRLMFIQEPLFTKILLEQPELRAVFSSPGVAMIDFNPAMLV